MAAKRQAGGKPWKSSDNTAAVAAGFGISLKALRLYEQLGMLAPPRTKAGWRVYGPDEIERLHLILSLKRLGLSLSRIAELLKGKQADLGALLDRQEEALLETRCETDHALALIRIARKSLAGKTRLTTHELAQLVRRTRRGIVRWTPELNELAKRIYTPAQLARFVERRPDADKAAALGRGWAEFYADLDPVMARGDPLSDDALAVVRRMAALIRETTCGDKDMWNQAARFWQEAVSDPATASQVPMTKAQYDFVAKGLAELRRRGELSP